MSTVDHDPMHEVTEKAEETEIIVWLEEQTKALLQRIRNEEFWTTLMDPETPNELVHAIMKEVYLEIVRVPASCD